MAMNSFADFGEMHRSVLQEICNMGAGNAATALSEMISSPTDISTPQVKVLAAAEAGRIADLLSRGTEAFLIKLSCDMQGAVLFIFPYAFIERLAGTFFPDTAVKGKGDMNEMISSVVRETVNICAASYANNFSIMTGMTVDISVPESTAAPSGELLKVNEGAVNVCFVNNTVTVNDCGKSFNILFFPELNTIQDFMGRIGVEC
ncbi:MAG: chemotaxis protein CheC [Oscillospiraceae bacterium]|nr:chemotaxis protein CheC [Oscillospiraceae bacterium]